MPELRRTAVVRYNGLPYERNLSVCRRALTARQVDGRFLDGMAGLATACQCSRSVVSRFFSGANVSPDLTMRILKALKLDFEDVHRPLPPSDDADGDG